jgi:hypothetical protein
MSVQETADGKYQVVDQDGKAIGKPLTTQNGALNKVKKLGAEQAAQEVRTLQDRVKSGQLPYWADEDSGENMTASFASVAQFWKTAVGNGAAPKGESEVNSMSSYQGGGYRPINKLMWSSYVAPNGKLLPNSTVIDDYLRKKTMREVADLMAASKRQSAPFAFTVYRATSPNHPLTEWAKQASVGDAYLNKGFDSTSFNPLMEPIESGGGTAARIIFDVPQGAKGLMFSGTPGYKDGLPHEMEWLAPANSKWAVKEVRDVNGVREVVVSLLSQRDLNGKVIWP